MVGTSFLHHPERIRSFDRALRLAWQTARLSRTSLMVGKHLEIIKLLGHGASAVVCEARDRKWKASALALKLFPREGGDAGFEAVRGEAWSLKLLHHENVVHVQDFDDAEIQPGGLQCYWLSMDLIEGSSLRSWLGRPREDAEILAIFRKIGEGLAYAHGRDIIHRDFKPENVMITSNDVPKLVDFGLASSKAAVDLRGVVGTPAFMAPEALRGAGLDERSDQFSFAATLWLALCRDFPYDPTNRDPGERRPVRPAPGHLSPALVECLRRALDPDPEARFSTMTQLLDELREAQTERPAPSAVSSAQPAPPSYGADSESYVLRGYSSASSSIPEIPAHVLATPASDPAPRTRSPWPLWSGLAAAVAGSAGAVYVASTRLDAGEPPPDVAAEGPEPTPVVIREMESPPVPVATAEVYSPPPTSHAPSPPVLAPPPTCAIPVEVDGRWLFSTVETHGDLTDKVGRYELDIDVDGCTVHAKLAKISFDRTTYEPPLRDDGPLTFSTVAPFAGRLAGAFKPRVPWETGAYTYDFTFFVEGKSLYGSYQARGSRKAAGLLRGHKWPKPAPTASESVRTRQPCLARCELDCPPTQCASACASPDAWARPICPTP